MHEGLWGTGKFIAVDVGLPRGKRDQIDSNKQRSSSAVWSDL